MALSRNLQDCLGMFGSLQSQASCHQLPRHCFDLLLYGAVSRGFLEVFRCFQQRFWLGTAKVSPEATAVAVAVSRSLSLQLSEFESLLFPFHDFHVIFAEFSHSFTLKPLTCRRHSSRTFRSCSRSMLCKFGQGKDFRD